MVRFFAITASLELVKLIRVIAKLPISTSLQWNCTERRLTFKKTQKFSSIKFYITFICRVFISDIAKLKRDIFSKVLRVFKNSVKIYQLVCFFSELMLEQLYF